ncbi:nuclear transport factor 2 family protein [Maribacter sp. ANRC-HE7]|uniref:Nuclear transport factor 2 family protein n=1 Tax=Maribacter aquimaris TaxID=2737171 RepID=A0ABR7V0K1_9FLAO|nr:nuclear transport factor 2 family protein [Maribacter aquimaris]MBD0776717.1 nuclear transport factor 2 family protein [Maribacter aquimaris]
MKNSNQNKSILTILVVLISGIILVSFRPIEDKGTYPPQEDTSLYDAIVAMDDIYFTAYNNCDMETQEKLYDEDLEFYHDKGGLSTSKQELLEGLEKNICGKVTRELVEGSIEVYPIPNFGAVEIGMHKFHNNQEPNAISNPSKFITIWKQVGESYKMTRVISLH